jgi:hypothetical protein
VKIAVVALQPIRLICSHCVEVVFVARMKDCSSLVSWG